MESCARAIGPHHLFSSIQSGRSIYGARCSSDLPQRSVLEPLYAKAGFADAFAIDLPSNATGDAERLAAHVLTHGGSSPPPHGADYGWSPSEASKAMNTQTAPQATATTPNPASIQIHGI
jgi:hypothetical protein